MENVSRLVVPLDCLADPWGWAGDFTHPPTREQRQWNYNVDQAGNPIPGPALTFEVFVWEMDLRLRGGISSATLRSLFPQRGYRGHAAAFIYWQRKVQDGVYYPIPEEQACREGKHLPISFRFQRRGIQGLRERSIDYPWHGGFCYSIVGFRALP